MTDRKRHGLILLLVLGLIAASIAVIATKPTRLGLDLKGGVELVYEAQSTPTSPVNNTSIARAITVMRNRIDQLGVTQAQIQQEGKDLIDVQLPDVHNVQQAEDTVGSEAELAFYDWEANLIMPDGHLVASQLLVSQTAQNMSEGAGSSSSAAGALDFYAAVKLAAKQPYNNTLASQNFDQYYLFGGVGSSACAAYAAANKTTPVLDQHCLIAQSEPGPKVSPAAAILQLKAGLSKAETQGTQVIVIKRGTIVVQATPTSFARADWPTFGTPTAGYYVLRDNAALVGHDVKNPQASTDQAGQPDVNFSFDSKGQKEFEQATKAIAQRGGLLTGNLRSQHFAVVLDGQLLSVPTVSPSFVDGISGSTGVQIYGNFTTSSANALAQELRLGALPVRLNRISESQVSATLGSRALHQGLLAGIVGLAIVMLFLIFYYRLLGVIAVGGLFVYGLYFYALIKLIPITMTLAGIAGLILTIGVAADANVVIFERVKEEIRAGRSVRQGIITGYRKGLTAIIDGNVVTIMTAFILFVLATADVKGFAFTLGIGTIVSLFTAVLATQAILLTLSDSRSISGPAALGAGGKKRVWRFDFMGAGRYFFTMSGVILAIGAFAIGAKGLNLGIDFTSGTQVSASLNHPANVSQISTMVKDLGVSGNTQIQATHGGDLGKYGVQISMKYLNLNQTQKLRDAIQSRYGVGQFNTNVIGPTFGNAVAHSAVVALIISLLLISVYITLRFDRKYAVPVLIALMHDLLITAGVYALTGKTVSTDTVAALLTILGYSMYDTIIVFDRVRENVPRMPRAAFSQIVNRSMSEVLTRSLVTTSCTLLPVVALLIFGGSTLKDFAFALLIGVASGAYSSIFIASPVLTHWKEREPGYKARRNRIIAEFGAVPAYAGGGHDVEPPTRAPRAPITAPGQAGSVSNEEFEQMTRELDLENEPAPSATKSKRSAGRGERRRGGSLPQRTAGEAAPASEPAVSEPVAPEAPEPKTEPEDAGAPAADSGRGARKRLPQRGDRPLKAPERFEDDEDEGAPAQPAETIQPGGDEPVERAPDVAENEGIADVKSGPSAPRKGGNSRKHGRRR